MKPFKSSKALILSTLTLSSISNANAGGCRSNIEKKVIIECLSEDDKFLDVKEKELLNEVEV